jgi:hypothetical protein
MTTFRSTSDKIIDISNATTAIALKTHHKIDSKIFIHNLRQTKITPTPKYLHSHRASSSNQLTVCDIVCHSLS